MADTIVLPENLVPREILQEILTRLKNKNRRKFLLALNLSYVKVSNMDFSKIRVTVQHYHADPSRFCPAPYDWSREGVKIDVENSEERTNDAKEEIHIRADYRTLKAS